MNSVEMRVPDTRPKAAPRISDKPPVYMEHRYGVRRPCKLRVLVSTSGGMAGTGRLRNISMSGAFIETPLPLPMYAQLRVAALHGDGSSHLLEFPAVVVRHDADGVGVEWGDATPARICQKLGCGTECEFARAEPG
jgi:hypothetical protein